MIRTVRWRPSTCGCIVEYEWDDAQAEPVYRLHRVISACKAHEDSKDVFEDVLQESRNREKVLARIIESAPSLVEEVVDSRTGDSSTRIRPALKPAVYYEGGGENRVLKVQPALGSLSLLQKSILQIWADSNIGTGKVVVE